MGEGLFLVVKLPHDVRFADMRVLDTPMEMIQGLFSKWKIVRAGQLSKVYEDV